jgi:hypothetical protein
MPETSFQSPASWCVSVLSPDHLAFAKSNLDLMVQFLHFLLPGISVEKMAEHIRDHQPWYVPFQTALMRLAEGHVRGVAFASDAAANLKTDLLAEIESTASEVASHKHFAGLKNLLLDPHAGETGNVKRALAAHAAANGVTLGTDSGKFDRRSLQVIGSNRIPALPHLAPLQSAKKALVTVDDYDDAARHDGRLHSLVSFTTVTGRTSSSEPSLQNVPRDVRFRRLFHARPGCVILAADYAAMELCIAAALADRVIADLHMRISSQDDGWFMNQVRRGFRTLDRVPYPGDLPDNTKPTLEWRAAAIASVANTVLNRQTQVMASILQQGLDPHLVTAADFARRCGRADFEGHPLQWILSLTSPNRQALKEKLITERHSAKAANFGLLYGMSKQGLHASGISKFGLEWTLDEASEA